MRSSAVRGNFTSGRRPVGSSSSVLKVPIKVIYEDVNTARVSTSETQVRSTVF